MIPNAECLGYIRGCIITDLQLFHFCQWILSLLVDRGRGIRQVKDRICDSEGFIQDESDAFRSCQHSSVSSEVNGRNSQANRQGKSIRYDTCIHSEIIDQQISDLEITFKVLGSALINLDRTSAHLVIHLVNFLGIECIGMVIAQSRGW